MGIMGLMVSNRGELARGWYERVVGVLRGTAAVPATTNSTRPPIPERPKESEMGAEDEEESSDDDVGPPIPGQERKGREKNGPGRPTFDDLEVAKSALSSTPYLQTASNTPLQLLTKKKQPTVSPTSVTSENSTAVLKKTL